MYQFAQSILFTHRAVVATSAQCFGIGTRIHFEQLRGDVGAFAFALPMYCGFLVRVRAMCIQLP